MKNKKPRGDGAPSPTEQAMGAAMLDALRLHGEFVQKVLPDLRELVAKGATPDQLYKRFTSEVAARAITMALVEPDSAKALSAVKEVLDRSQGKATEKHEIKHQYDELSTEQLESLVRSKIAGAGLEDEDTVQ